MFRKKEMDIKKSLQRPPHSKWKDRVVPFTPAKMLTHEVSSTGPHTPCCTCHFRTTPCTSSSPLISGSRAVHTNTRARWAIQENPTFSQKSSVQSGLLTQLWEAAVAEGDRSSSVMCQSPSPSFMALRRGEAEPGSRGSSSSQLDLGQHTPINISNTV